MRSKLITAWIWMAWVQGRASELRTCALMASWAEGHSIRDGALILSSHRSCWKRVRRLINAGADPGIQHGVVFLDVAAAGEHALLAWLWTNHRPSAVAVGNALSWLRQSGRRPDTFRLIQSWLSEEVAGALRWSVQESGNRRCRSL